MTALRDYHGVRLVISEATVMEELEAQLGEPIPHINRLGRYKTFGFTSNHNCISELSLSGSYLGSVKLLSLPEAIGQLQSLRKLNLGFNLLQSLPDTIGQLQNLQELFLKYNQLQSLPGSIGQLQTLQHLDLLNNQLVSLPDTIGQLRRLQGLILSGNPLQSLPESIGQLQSLKMLALSENQLSLLLDSIVQLQNLQRINILDNPLNNSLSSRLTLLWLVQENDLFKKWVLSKLFTYPLVQPLEPDSLKHLSKAICPFCGKSGLISGRDKKTGKERIFCAECENSVQ